MSSAIEGGRSSWSDRLPGRAVTSRRRLVGGTLVAVGLFHWIGIASLSVVRDTGESLLAVTGFAAIELLLFLVLLPVLGFQIQHLRVPGIRAEGPGLGLVLAHLFVAILVVVSYRAAVLSVALLVELGNVPMEQIALWWRSGGSWQVQADLFLYGGLGGLVVSRHGERASPGGDTGGPRAVTALGDEDESGGEAGPGNETDVSRERLTVSSGGTVHVVAVEDIRWLEGDGSYVRIHTGTDTYLLRDTLTSLASRLEPAGLVRVHRSAIINLGYLERLRRGRRGTWTAHLFDGTRVRVAASRKGHLEAALGDTLG